MFVVLETHQIPENGGRNVFSKVLGKPQITQNAGAQCKNALTINRATVLSLNPFFCIF